MPKAPRSRYLIRCLELTAALVCLTTYQNCGRVGAPAESGTSFCRTQPEDPACITPAAARCLFNGRELRDGERVTAYLNASGTTTKGCSFETRVCTHGVMTGSFAYGACAIGAPSACLFNGLTIASGQAVVAYLNSTSTLGGACQAQTRSCDDGTLAGTYTFASCSAVNYASCSFNGQTIAHGVSVTAYDQASVAAGATCRPHVRTCFNGALSGAGEFANCVVDAPTPCLFNGQTIANGQSVTAFAESSVPSGHVCASETRVCQNGNLSGSAAFASCAVAEAAACLIDGRTIPDGAIIKKYAATVAALGSSCAIESRTCSNGTLGGSATASSCLDCNALVASTDPKQNSSSISSCLGVGGARLGTGVFPLAAAVRMPAGASLSGLGTSTTLSAAPSVATAWGNALGTNFPDNSIVETSGGNTLSNVRITGDGQVRDDCCSSVVAITGSANRLDQVEIFDLDPTSGALPPARVAPRVVGVYFIGDADSNGNVVNNALVHDLFMGAIFRAKLPKDGAGNRLTNSEIMRTACDGITMVGFGIVQQNKIHDTGYDCLQRPTPIPGAGIYAVDNPDGGRIIGNTITNQCGHGLDLNQSNSFVISENTVTQSGAPLNGQYSYCAGSSAVALSDVSSFSIKNNTFVSNDTPPLGIFLQTFPAFASDPAVARALSPLPQRNQQVIALRLLKINGVSVNNTIDGNQAVGTCSTSACVGIGIYVGPGVGLDASGNWSAATTNYFTRNRVNGSNIGSLRCGSDWYAANDACLTADAGGACNDDDFQHVPNVNASWSRADYCSSH